MSAEPESAPNGDNGDTRDPAGFLSDVIGAPVTVKLNSGVLLRGELQAVDGYMNIALEDSKEFVNGKLRRNYGDTFIRGSNGIRPPCHQQDVRLISNAVMYISADAAQ
ncbi:hypothetical protein AC578_9123 [Pseudocercospora eumusae]|uniref:U6 snRNA-associated Sm-like protein LSm6 n=1 Tax=Pseudocercospora eumusae TaxID=321146 RepID=A0A139HVH7_9PEZI|nr:hypothetical protein AC578_9123 [Pseudocercospora eumusae]